MGKGELGIGNREWRIGNREWRIEELRDREKGRTSNVQHRMKNKRNI